MSITDSCQVRSNRCFIIVSTDVGRVLHGHAMPSRHTIDLLFSYQRPGKPGHPTSQGNGRLRSAASCLDTMSPVQHGVIGPFALRERRPGTMDKQGPQVAITAFGDAGHVSASAAGVLPGRDAQPDRNVAGMVELFATTQCTDRGSCGDIANARNRQQQSAQRAIQRYVLQLFIQLIQAVGQAVKFVFYQPELFLDHGRKAGVGRIRDVGQ